MSEWRDKGVEIDVTVIGRKGLGFFKRVGVNIVSEATQLGDKPQLSRSYRRDESDDGCLQ